MVRVPSGGQVSFNSLRIVRNNNVVSSSLHYCAAAAAALLLFAVLDAHLGNTILALSTGRSSCV
jgi:hypothetical protein